MEKQRSVSQKAIVASIVVILLSFYLFQYVQEYIRTFSSSQNSSINKEVPIQERRVEETISSNEEKKLEGTPTNSNDTTVQTSDPGGKQQDSNSYRVQPKQPSKTTSPVNSKKYITSCTHWDSVIDKYAQNKSESTWAKRVMRCESGCRENAYNSKSGASGLFQIIVKWHPSMVGKVFDGEESIKYSLMKYRQGGSGLWVCK